jgi:DNA-binding NarL/FixJ family response regulator
MQPCPKRRILVVDVHEISRRGWYNLVSREDDLEICGEADTAAQALALVKQTSPDVVVTGLSLPDHNGLELVEQLKASHPNLPVLVVSIYDEEVYGERVFRVGALGYIMKTAPGDELLVAVRQVLRGKHYMSSRLSEFYFSAMVPGPPSKLPLARLTSREMQIFDLIGIGESNERISERLNIGIRTVERHRTNMRKRLGLADASELLRYAFSHFNDLSGNGNRKTLSGSFSIPADKDSTPSQ